MYREWKSGASFRKARPACEFTTSWKQSKFSLNSKNNEICNTNAIHSMPCLAAITNTLCWAKFCSFRVNGKPHLSFFLPDRTHDIQSRNINANVSKHQDLSVSIFITLTCHMLYKLCSVKYRPQALLGEAIKFKCFFFEVRKHWVNRFLDEQEPFWFDSKMVGRPEKRRLLVTVSNVLSFFYAIK